MTPVLMRVHVRSSIDGVVFFSFLYVWAVHNAEFSDDCQNRLNNGSAVRAERLVLHLVSVSLSFYAIKTTALALAGSRLGAEPTNKLLQNLVSLHCLLLQFSSLDSVTFWTDHKFVIRAIAALFCCC